jgi:hypothetical protein
MIITLPKSKMEKEILLQMDKQQKLLKYIVENI